MKYRILIADDHRIVREGLMSLIEKDVDLEVVGTAANGLQALKMTQKLKPDVVIMDIAMPGLNGIDTTSRIVDEIPGVKVIALSMHSEKKLVHGMLRAGASGYLLKESAFEELIKAIRAVCTGKKYLSPEVTGIVLSDYVTLPSENNSIEMGLTQREREVLQLIAEGCTTREIAYRIHLSTKTVESHRSNIMNKLDLHSVAELTKYAIRNGISLID